MTPWTRRLVCIGLSLIAVTALVGTAFGSIPADTTKELVMIIAAGFLGAMRRV